MTVDGQPVGRLEGEIAVHPDTPCNAWFGLIRGLFIYVPYD